MIRSTGFSRIRSWRMTNEGEACISQRCKNEKEERRRVAADRMNGRGGDGSSKERDYHRVSISVCLGIVARRRDAAAERDCNMRLLSQGEDSERGSFMSLTVACQRGNIRPPCTSEGCSMHVDQLMMLDSQASSSMTLAGEKQRRSCSSRQQKHGGKKNEK